MMTTQIVEVLKVVMITAILSHIKENALTIT